MAIGVGSVSAAGRRTKAVRTQNTKRARLVPRSPSRCCCKLRRIFPDHRSIRRASSLLRLDEEVAATEQADRDDTTDLDVIVGHDVPDRDRDVTNINDIGHSNRLQDGGVVAAGVGLLHVDK